MASDEAFISILNAVLAEVCSRCNFVHAEALQPSGAACMVQSGANYSTTSGGADFHRASVNFVYPPYVCIPGRVWKTQQSEWHKNVSELPVSLFIRADIAKITDLKSCFAMPLGRKGQISAVLLFYSSHAIPYSRNLEQTIVFLANDILSEVCTKKGAHACSDLQFFTQGEHPAPKKSQSVISKVWESAKAALGIPPEQRTDGNVSDIIKFSKRLPFFKYVTNTSREVLCKGMQIIQLEDGEVVVRSQERQEFVWYIVIKGGADLVLCAEPGAQAYVVHAFQEGDTFAHPYIDLYSSGVAGIEGCIRSSEANTSCVRVFVPEGCREDFRAQTKPLWYKELAVYFYLSVDEAAEKLGMCMSAIKKVCRRHGIIRWPHRKLLGADKALAVLASKVASTTADPVARAAWQTEAVNILVAKLRLTLDPKYLSDWVQLDPVVGGGAGQSSRSSLTSSSLLVDGHSTSDEDSPLEGPAAASLGSALGVSRAQQQQQQHPKSPSRRSSISAPSATHDTSAASSAFPSQRPAQRAMRGPQEGQDESVLGGHGARNQTQGSVAGAGMDGIDGLYNQLQMVPLHAREAVLMKLLEVQRMSSSIAQERPPPRDYTPFAPQPPLHNLVHPRPPDMQPAMRSLPASNHNLYDDAMQWRVDYTNGAPPGGLRMQPVRSDTGHDAADNGANGSRRLPQPLGMQQFRSHEFDYGEGMMQQGGNGGKLPSMKQCGALDTLSRPMFHPASSLPSDPCHASLDSAHRKAYAEQANGRGGGGLLHHMEEPGGEGSRGYAESAHPNQVRKNIHLLCDMLGGPSNEQPSNFRARKRGDEGPPLDMSHMHQRARHLGPS